ncbi:MAG: leishmanolysin-related zinc metalloendopeptidase [Alphaproteobacteria bacterium]
MEFDIADADNYNTMPSGSEGTLWDDIVVHEMLHSIGFGTIWSYLNLLSGAGTSDPRFMGANAIAAYNDSGGTVDGGVQVEGSSYAGPGTRDSHWDEDAFGNELMTGYINNSDNYLSNITIASLEDLGYDTIYIG